MRRQGGKNVWTWSWIYGGTIDKLESIKNFNTQIPVERFIDIINEIGISIVGQLKNLAPADKKYIHCVMLQELLIVFR